MHFVSILVAIFIFSFNFSAQESVKPTPIVICSYDMEPLILLWQDLHQTSDPKFKLDVRPSSSRDVARAFIEGRSQLAPINREFTQEETTDFTTKWGYAPTRLAVGIDALVILVHKNNPLKTLRIDQLDAIWTTTRLSGYPKDILTWGDLGLVGANGPLDPSSV